jgi:para-nitrobenzyl esterase
MRHLICTLSLVLSIAVVKAQPTPVKVKECLIQGTYENGLSIYKGIPFAAPPVGELRWRAPQPAAKWDGIRMANKFAAEPMQGASPFLGKSEDCLYLNVWSPAKSPGDKIPVLVWVYGGAFNWGALLRLLIMAKSWQKRV